MAITNSDIVYRLTTNGLGGTITATAVTDNNLNNVWDDVTGDEGVSGDTEYRCIYVRNSHGSLTFFGPIIWFPSNSSNATTTISMGLGTSAVNGTEQTITNESTAPSGVTFSAPSTKAAGLALGDLPTGQHKAIWLKRVVDPSAMVDDADTYSIKVEGDTNA